MICTGSPMNASKTIAMAALAGFSASAVGCRTASLKRGAEHVSAGRVPPPKTCKPLGYLTGRGGGTFGGAWVSNDKLTEYALNDLRNKASELGGNYVHHDAPQLGAAEGTTSTVTITGTAYRCSERIAVAGSQPEHAAVEPSKQSAPPEQPTPKGTASRPPSGAAGFDFDQSLETTESACRGAGHQWRSFGNNRHQCSGSLVDLGTTATVLIGLCDGRTCEIQVDVPVTGKVSDWERAYTGFESALIGKYGTPHVREDSLPSECAGDAARQCYESAKARRRARWEWPSGERITSNLGKSASGGTVEIRIYYSNKPSAVKSDGL
jgi:hypothetical protein